MEGNLLLNSLRGTFVCNCQVVVKGGFNDKIY